MRASIVDSLLLITCPALVSSSSLSSRNYYKFGGKDYPLHNGFPARSLLHMSGGDIEEQQNTISDENVATANQSSSSATGQDATNKATTSSTSDSSTIPRKPLKEPSFLRRGWQRSVGSAFQKPKLNLPELKESSSKLLSAVGPATVAYFSSSPEQPISLPAIYALALLGSSSGFYLFLYFITVGYASGILLPLLASMVAYNRTSKIPLLTNLHCSLVILWALRSISFFLYREFIAWPQLHEKVVEVNKAARLPAKLFCWVTFSVFYVCMILPCCGRLQHPTRSWGVFGILAIMLQVCGLVLETVADHQKSVFKKEHPNEWCHEGLWSASTHPNYLGEAIFWIATYCGGIKCCNWWRGGASTVGLLFILVVLRGAVTSLGAKHLRKYGHIDEFLEFRRTHGVLGRKLFLKPQPEENILSL